MNRGVVVIIGNPWPEYFMGYRFQTTAREANRGVTAVSMPGEGQGAGEMGRGRVKVSGTSEAAPNDHFGALKEKGSGDCR